ncbi:MAG: hypothetical protein IT304_02585 [Dehalococcoidia bacterium]|nr:hypothetical protein [Dehalococcoidia bacterium]
MLHVLALMLLAGGLVVARVVLPVVLATADVPGDGSQPWRGGRVLRLAPLAAVLVVTGAAALATLT